MEKITIFPRNLSCQSSYFQEKLIALFFLRFSGWKWKICWDQGRLTFSSRGSISCGLVLHSVSLLAGYKWTYSATLLSYWSYFRIMPKCVSKLCFDVAVVLFFWWSCQYPFHCNSVLQRITSINISLVRLTTILLKPRLLKKSRYGPHKMALNQRGLGRMTAVRGNWVCAVAPKQLSWERFDWHWICTTGWLGKMLLTIPTSPGNILKNVMISCSDIFFLL